MLPPNKVVVSLVFLADIAAGALFAQAPTLDKLTFIINRQGMEATVSPANNTISGAVVIPSTYNGLPGTTLRAFFLIALDNRRIFPPVILPRWGNCPLGQES
jgi:hypothetical protein